MGKHAKQAATRQFFTSGEREKAKGRYGTSVQRLGIDSQRKFDECNLCLSHLVDPVASPAGNLFCRECILKNLLAQKEALDVQKKSYDEWKRLKAAALSAEAEVVHAAAIRAFETLEGGVSSSLQPVYAQSAETLVLQEERRVVEDATKSKSEKVDNRSRDEKREEMRKASFWIPESAPEATDSGVSPPDPAPRDPVSGDFLRAKQLVTVHLTLANPPATDDDDTGIRMAADGSGTAGRFMCPACMRTIVFQQTYLFKSCGHVLCDKCVSNFVAPTKKCFVCTASVLKTDVVKLQQGGSAFAGHEGTQSEARKYAPTLIT